MVEELGQAPAAEVGKDEECRPRLATRLTLNPNWQINHLFRGPLNLPGAAGPPGGAGTEGCHTDLEEQRGARSGQVRWVRRPPSSPSVPLGDDSRKVMFDELC